MPEEPREHRCAFAKGWLRKVWRLVTRRAPCTTCGRRWVLLGSWGPESVEWQWYPTDYVMTLRLPWAQRVWMYARKDLRDLARLDPGHVRKLNAGRALVRVTRSGTDEERARAIAEWAAASRDKPR